MSSPVSTAHPAARARGRHLVGMARAVRPLVDVVSGPHKSVALAALAVRGSQARTREEFATAYGLDLADLSALEGGMVAAHEVPDPLLVLTPITQLIGELEEPWSGGGGLGSSPAVVGLAGG